MRRSLGIVAALTLLVIPPTVFAQAQPAQQQGDTSAAAESEPATGETAAADEPAAPDDQAAQEMSDLSDLVEEDASVEAKADEEFTPGDEISEDYPVPLPSDI